MGADFSGGAHFPSGCKLFQEGRETEGGVNYLRLWDGYGAGFSAGGGVGLPL